ncbi:hypothetical protein EV401DRAFT_2025171 [Pisolithus croceorrhizus]|nr:hypothetical protein EV401DRAFT_2025171 [Pisolithus croceorrhizus]
MKVISGLVILTLRMFDSSTFAVSVDHYDLPYYNPDSRYECCKRIAESEGKFDPHPTEMVLSNEGLTLWGERCA